MDNVIYIVLAAAVFIALAGILLFIGTDPLENVFSDSEDIRTEDPDEWVDINSYSYYYLEDHHDKIHIKESREGVVKLHG